MPNGANANTTRAAISIPIRWVGCRWDPQRAVFFRDAIGRRFEISLQGAVDGGMFEWETTTPARRDALLAWAADPAMQCPPQPVETSEQEARHD